MFLVALALAALAGLVVVTFWTWYGFQFAARTRAPAPAGGMVVLGGQALGRAAWRRLVLPLCDWYDPRSTAK